MASTIKEEWEMFRKASIPGASKIQRTEMERAFYAGILVMLNLQLELGEESVTEDEALEVLESWHTECDAFFKTMVSLH